MDQFQSSIPDFGLSNSPSRDYTPPHNYTRIIIPTHGLDRTFNQKIADLMEWSYQNTEEASNLEFLIQECYQQMGCCYDHSHVKFIYALQGNPAEVGVPGYPTFSNLTHINFDGRLVAFVTIFRDAILNFFAIVNPYSQVFPGMDFVFHKYIPNGWVFYLTPAESPVF